MKFFKIIDPVPDFILDISNIRNEKLEIAMNSFQYFIEKDKQNVISFFLLL